MGTPTIMEHGHHTAFTNHIVSPKGDKTIYRLKYLLLLHGQFTDEILEEEKGTR